MSSTDVLVAGIGNIFFGDDGFGVEVAQRLADVDLPEGVRLGEWGIRGLHLAFELLDGCDTLVLVDALPMGEEPGTVAVVEADLESLAPGPDGPVLDAHTMSPASVLAALDSLGGSVRRALVVGCQPHTIDEGIGLSEVVAAAVEPAARAVVELVEELTGARIEEVST